MEEQEQKQANCSVPRSREEREEERRERGGERRGGGMPAKCILVHQYIVIMINMKFLKHVMADRDSQVEICEVCLAEMCKTKILQLVNYS